MQNKNMKFVLINIVLTIVGVIYILFLYLDIFGIKDPTTSNILKFISIILCFIIALLIGKDRLNRRDKLLLQVGLFFTVLADLSFLILGCPILGVALFCLVQIVYYNRYKGGVVYSSYFIFVKFILISLIVLAGYFLINLTLIKVHFLYALGFFYAICLILSIAQSIKALKNNLYPSLNSYLIVIGMILFLLCDVSIAISVISEQFNLPNYNTFASLIWFFYLPSQVLLCLSGYGLKRNKRIY